MISARLSCEGVTRLVWDPTTFAKAEARPTGRDVFKERLGDWDGQTDVWARLCPPRRAMWHNGERGYSTRRHMLEPVRTETVLPDRALCLPTFSHFLIVNTTSLSLSLALPLPLSGRVYRLREEHR